MIGMTEPWLPCKDRHVAEVWARTDRGCYLEVAFSQDKLLWENWADLMRRV